jgi:lactate dehydrogenase-like 2-hydroxyacid dehydrogenase
MEVAIFSSTPYERKFLDEANKAEQHTLRYLDVQLGPDTVGLAAGFGAVCIFVNDKADAPTLEALHRGGTRLLALRCTGFNNVDLEAAARLGIKVVRVVTYSPNSVAEFAVALLLAINRKVHRAYNRTRDSNFSLDGLIGFDLFGKTVAVVGTGKIGCVFAQIMIGFGCDVIGYDPYHSAEFEALGGRYAKPGEIGSKADIVSLHCPLDARDASHHQRGHAQALEARRAAHQHEPWRADRHRSRHRGAEERPVGRARHRRVRAGKQSFLPRPVQRDHSGRCDAASRLVSERDRDGASGVSDARSADDHL